MSHHPVPASSHRLAPPRHSPIVRRLWPGCLLLVAACGGGGDSGPAGSGGGRRAGGSGNPLDVVLEFQLENRSALARTETVRASIPFPERGYTSLSNLVVSGEQTAWLPLQYWADGSIKVAQAQFTAELPPGTTQTFRIARDEPAMTGGFVRNEWVQSFAAGLQIGAEVRDTFQVAYRSFANGAGEVLQESPLVQTRRWRTYHTAVGGGGIGRDYLTSTYYVTEFRDMPFVVVDWILGNDYLGADVVPPGNTDPNLRPLGTVDVRQASFLCRGATAVVPYRPTQENIAAPVAIGGGFQSAVVMQDTFLEDAQTRRYRFLLRFEPSGAAPVDLARWRDSATAMMQDPLYPLATQSTFAGTAAAGLLGGPIAGPADAASRAAAEYGSWAGANHFGTWGSRGDPLVTATTGTPRNHALSPELAHAIQGGYPLLLQALEQKAWAQAMRPYHLYGLVVGAEQDLSLWDGTPHWVSPEQLGRRFLTGNDPYAAYRTLRAGQPRAHGWEHFDHEHWSCDLLFDYWTMSGDAWAKEELRQLGESLKGLMRLRTFFTAGIQAARAEGWCMQGFAQCYQATRDASLKDYALRRANEVVDANRRKDHPSKALTFQSNYPGTSFPLSHEFYMPWQHGALLYGYLGAYVAFDEPVLLEIATDVVDTVAYAWVTNHMDPVRGLVPNGLRYYVPISHNGAPVQPNVWDTTSGIGVKWGDSPLGGAHSFLTGGLFHLADLTNDAGVRQRAEQYGGLLLGSLTANARWDKWSYCLPVNYEP